MDGRKAAIAITVVAILIVSTCAIAGIIIGSPNTVGTGKDVVSNDLGKGDYYEINMTADTSSYSNSYKSHEEYYGWIYDTSGIEDPLHTKVIKVNGKEVECHTHYLEYVLEDVNYLRLIFVDEEKQRSYGYELYANDVLSDCKYLVSTSFSLDKEKSEQVMDPNTKLSYTTGVSVTATVCPAVSITMDSTVTETVGSLDIPQGKYSIYVEQHMVGSQDARATVEDFIRNASGETVTTTDGNILDKSAYLMAIDYEQFLKYISDTKQIYSHGTSTTKTIDTVYGKRVVTEHNITVFGDIDSEYTVDYGENNVVYSITEKKRTQTGTVEITIKSSNLISEITTEVYENPFVIKNESFLVGVIIAILVLIAALLIGYSIFKYLIEK